MLMLFCCVHHTAVSFGKLPPYSSGNAVDGICFDIVSPHTFLSCEYKKLIFFLVSAEIKGRAIFQNKVTMAGPVHKDIPLEPLCPLYILHVQLTATAIRRVSG